MSAPIDPRVRDLIRWVAVHAATYDASAPIVEFFVGATEVLGEIARLFGISQSEVDTIVDGAQGEARGVAGETAHTILDASKTRSIMLTHIAKDLHTRKSHAARGARRAEGDAMTAAASDYPHILANLTATQARCTELLIEVRAYRASGICLPGWTCRACSAFNGSVRETLAVCRCCGTPR